MLIKLVLEYPHAAKYLLASGVRPIDFFECMSLGMLGQMRLLRSLELIPKRVLFKLT